MRARVYVETSVISYLCARASRDVVATAHRDLTMEWWRHHRNRFDLYVSELVLAEAGRGDSGAARRRSAALQGLPVLELTPEARELAKAFLKAGSLPARAAEDALHIAIATVNAIGFLLTWNCRHIANAEVAAKINRTCAGLGLAAPVLCTPEQLMGD